MKQFILLFTLILTFSLFGSKTLIAGTDIPGGDVEGTWTLENAPYMILGEITIQDGHTLVIEPGVEVIFAGHYKFNVFGQLLAEGTSDYMITFTADNTASGWHGLRFLDVPVTNDSSKLVYCKIEYGRAAGPSLEERYGGGIYVKFTDKLLIAFCEITNNKTIGDLATGGGGIAIDSCSPVITQNWIAYNEADGGHGGGMGIIANAKPIITNNIIVHNSAFGGGGVVITNCKPIFINNTITQNEAHHGGGLDIIDTSWPTFINCINYENTASLAGDEVHFVSGTQANFYNCDLQGGVAAFSNDFGVGYPDYNGTFDNNIDLDPEFVNADNDFHLSSTSPCIGAGIASVEVDGIIYDAPSVDFEGQDRPQPAGSSPDMGGIESEHGIPVGIEKIDHSNASMLLGIYPNPARTEAWIPYQVGKSTHVTIEILNLIGDRIATLSNRFHNTGEHIIRWNTADISNGIYICTMHTDKKISSRKIIIEK